VTNEDTVTQELLLNGPFCLKDIVMTMTRVELIGLALLLPIYATATVKAQTITILTEPRALGIAVLRIEMKDLSDDRAVYLELKGPNDAGYRELYLFSSDYSEVRGSRFSAPVDGTRQLIVPVFVSDVKTWEHGKHVFDRSGVYSIRLKAYHYDVPRGAAKELILFERQVEFGEPSDADLEYFVTASQEKTWSTFGFDKARMELMAATTKTLIGLGIVQQIVHSTQHKGDPSHGKAEWADPLYELAFAVPDSSYAPYLAYYAACSYMWQRKAGFIRKTYGYELPDKRIADLDYYKKARSALEFAAERGDPYIKPFAMCFLAGMKAWAADLNGARELIKNAKKEPNTPKQIAELTDQVERYTEKFRSQTGK